MAETKNTSFTPRKYGKKDCANPIIGGNPSTRYDFVIKPDNSDNEFPDPDLDLPPQCIPWYYYNMKVGALWALNNITVNENVLSIGEVVSNNGVHVLSNKKNLPFDMPHPNKKGWRLRHVCIEGPEIAVYYRGRVSEDGVINLPNYWDGLVNIDDISINLTPIGSWQELFVEKVENYKIYVKNNNQNQINADFQIIARRLDDDLIVEYEGENYTDYPNGNEGYAFNYEHTYVENLINQQIEKKLNEKNV